MLTSRGRAQRHLPWGSVPLDEISFEDRCAGLPPRHLPLSGFLTLSAVSSPRGLVALFHATSVHRLPAFRAFSARSAVTPLGVPCSPVVTYSARRSTEAQQRSTTPTPEPCSNRAADTRRDAINASSDRCSPGLSPLRGFPIPVTGPQPSPHVLHPSSDVQALPTTDRTAGYAIRVWRRLRESPQPP